MMNPIPGCCTSPEIKASQSVDRKLAQNSHRSRPQQWIDAATMFFQPWIHLASALLPGGTYLTHDVPDEQN